MELYTCCNRWKQTNPSAGTVWTLDFKKDGTFTQYTNSNFDGEETTKGTYKINGKTLTIKLDGEPSSFDSEIQKLDRKEFVFSTDEGEEGESDFWTYYFVRE